MKVMHKLFVVALLLSLTLSVGAVMAQDDVTFEQSDVQTVSIETGNEDLKSISTEIDTQENEKLSSEGGGGESTDLIGVFPTGTNFTDIQDTIDSAKAGDTIFLNGETYFGSSPINITTINHLTIIGGSETEPDKIATLDAQGKSRILTISANNITIKGIKFINGK